MEKLRYEFDPHNRLVAKSGLRGIRKVIDGQFKVSAQNTLTYHLKSPFPSGANAPHQLKLTGAWSLTKEHQLRLTLDQWSRQAFGEELTLQAEILDVKDNSLLFALKTQNKDGLPALYTLELSGVWQADEQNRLCFGVSRQGGREDLLVFEGAWQISKNYHITYAYAKEQLIRKLKQAHTLRFQGHWDIQDKARLSFVLGAGSGSRFDFRAAVGVFKDNYIKYELGIGLPPKKQAITFFGKWQLKKDAGLVFEVRQEERYIQSFVFGAQVKLAGKGMLAFNLRNSRDKGVGAEIELSRDILAGSGQAFLRLLKQKRELAVLAGAGWRW